MGLVRVSQWRWYNQICPRHDLGRLGAQVVGEGGVTSIEVEPTGATILRCGEVDWIYTALGYGQLRRESGEPESVELPRAARRAR